jgi:hypothetical protein
LSEDNAILFGGAPVIPPPEVFENARKNNPFWYQLLEAAYVKLAAQPTMAGILPDPKGKGATVEQVGMVCSLFTGIEPYCVLARAVPGPQIARLNRVVKYSSARVVEILKKIQYEEQMIGATTLHHDGKTGHCIIVKQYDKARDRFIYHDPWPMNSLLCKENNMAGVDAKKERKYWSVTSKELESVIFASFIFPHQWARLQGVDFDLFYDTWRKSEFYNFFHLNLVSENTGNGISRRIFAPGRFKDEISLIVDSKTGGKIINASLLLNKAWMIGNFLMSLDLSKSFILSFAPNPDKDKYAEIASALWKLKDPRYILNMKGKDPAESDIIKFVHAFMGSVESASINTDLGTLSFTNFARMNEFIQAIEFILF